MTNENLAEITRAANDWGLASWLGGTMFGQFALNPAVGQVSDRRERGKVVNAAWNGYNAIPALARGGGGGLDGRAADRGRSPRLTERERSVAKAKDALTATALASGLVSAIQGGRLAKSAPDGAVPVERGLKPASETPREAAARARAFACSAR